MKVAFATYAVAPYRTKQLEKIVQKLNLDICVYYLGTKMNTRGWEVKKSKYFKEKKIKGFLKIKNHFIFYLGIKKIVIESDVILLGGYSSLATFIFQHYSKKYNKPNILVMDGISPSKSIEKPSLKFLLKKYFIYKTDLFWANGKISENYLVKNFNINKNKIFNQYLTVDIETIMNIRDTNNIIMKQKKEERYQDKKVVIYSGRLLAGKRIDILIKAISLLQIKEKVVLLILGGGEEEGNLKKLAHQEGVELIITGFIKSQEELFKLYLYGDCFVLPSEDDAWGLVVNEAEAAGLPVVVSQSCGCHPDLVKEGINGYTYQSNDVLELTSCIEKILLDEILRTEMSKKSINIISEWTFDSSAESFKKLLNTLNKEEYKWRK